MTLEENVVEQVVKSHNKNQKKHVMKSKGIAKKFNDKCFICNKTMHLAKDYRNKGKQWSLKKRIVQVNVIKVDHLTNKVSEMSLSCVVSKVNLINNPK